MTETTYPIELHCDGNHVCKAPVSYIDHKGYLYCTHHGKQMQQNRRCRKLLVRELRAIKSGEALVKY